MTDDEDLEGTDERTATARPRGGASESPRSIDDFTREGALVDGKYRVERVIGAGGMGVVVAAMHLALGERVALKFIKRGAASADAIERMRREARITFRLAGPHVARLLDVGDLPTGAPYLVMEHLAGEDLARTLARRGPLPVTEAVDYVMQACDGVAEAHELGVVHRDLKPSNLFLVSRKDGAPLVKVLDFGVAKARGLLGESSDVTTASSVLGSPLYMSPEQVRGAKHVDAASDVWSLGVILHELVAGAPPFARGPGSAVCAAIAADAPARLRDARPDAPEGLEAIVLRCLDKDPKRRFDGVEALGVALAPFADGASTGSFHALGDPRARAERAPTVTLAKAALVAVAAALGLALAGLIGRPSTTSAPVVRAATTAAAVAPNALAPAAPVAATARAGVPVDATSDAPTAAPPRPAPVPAPRAAPHVATRRDHASAPAPTHEAPREPTSIATSAVGAAPATQVPSAPADPADVEARATSRRR